MVRERTGGGDGGEVPIQGRGRREWAGVPSLTHWPLQTHPRSAKQAHPLQGPHLFSEDAGTPRPELPPAFQASETIGVGVAAAGGRMKPRKAL